MTEDGLTGGRADGQMGRWNELGTPNSRHLALPVLPSARLPVLLALAACQASTSRPYFNPLPEAAHAEVELLVPEATRTLAEALRADSIPVVRVEQRDGFLDSRWFDAKTLQPAHGRPLGSGVVRVRAWVTPAKPGFSEYEVEAVYRPLLDPSRPDRELEEPVPMDHPIGRRIAGVVKKLVEKYGEPVPPPAKAVADTGRARARPDSTARRADTTRRAQPPPKRDTLPGKRDTIPPKRDTIPPMELRLGAVRC